MQQLYVQQMHSESILLCLTPSPENALWPLSNHLSSPNTLLTWIPLHVPGYRTDDYGPALERLYRGNCAAALLGYFEYEQYVRAQTASFTACVDPADENGW